MKCSKCNTEMTKGVLSNHGMSWAKYEKERGGFMETIGGRTPVIAWKCETCNKIELSTT